MTSSSRRALLGWMIGAVGTSLTRGGRVWAQAPGPLVTVYKDPT